MSEKRGDFQKAKDYYYRAIEEGISKFTDTYYKRLMELFIEKNQYDDALIAVDKALSFANTKSEYIYFKAMILDYKEDGTKAIDLYKKYCETTMNEGKYNNKAKERLLYLEEYLGKKRKQ
jgi:tetratricopeptide (TPR) repeat protein